MKSIYKKLPALIFSVACAAAPSHAALVAVDLDGNAGNGHEAVYDTVLDITWLADANLAASNNFGITTNPDGSMNWIEAEAFIAAMNVSGGLGYLGVNTWRQTTASGCDGNGCGDVPHDTADELGYHYHQNFGATTGNPMISGANTANAALFSNIEASYYWTQDEPDPTRAWLFSANIGRQTFGLKAANDFFVWAVADGNVGSANAVPVPAAAWMFGSALLGLVRLRVYLQRGSD